MTNTIYQVFSALGIQNCNDNVNSLVKTPVNAIDIITPTAPIVLKNNRKQNDYDDFRSENSLAITDFGFSASDISLTANEKEAESSLNELQDEKKSLSQSNPLICVSRSDTFVREKKQKANTNDDNDVFQDNFNNNETNYSVHNNLLLSLNEVQKSIMNVVTKVERIKKQVYPQVAKQDNFNGKQTRRLGASLSNGSFGLNHTPAMNKTNLSTTIRRSITVFSGTPTSSRSSSIDRENTCDRRNSTGIAISGKLSESKKLGHSMSNLNLSLCNKVSSDSIPKRTKNPKYAHVQSTIPKPIQTKKKMQSPKVQ
ncbi:uncharacterized protein [Linepithema humile]